MTCSDNTCNDVLLWAHRWTCRNQPHVGREGDCRRRVRPWRKAVAGAYRWTGMATGVGRRLGIAASPCSYDLRRRDKALRRYLSDPLDGASANGVTLGLSLLAQGKLLSAQSTTSLLTLMRSSKTGPLRLKSGLRPGWTCAQDRDGSGSGHSLDRLQRRGFARCSRWASLCGRRHDRQHAPTHTGADAAHGQCHARDCGKSLIDNRVECPQPGGALLCGLRPYSYTFAPFSDATSNNTRVEVKDVLEETTTSRTSANMN